MMKTDWLSLCLEMMSEYFPIEIHSKHDAEKYWNINGHLLHIMEHSGITSSHNGNERLNERNDLTKNMIRLFAKNNMCKIESANAETDEISDNIALNNLLLLSILD